jgi:ABC-2 type transport system permease protein
MFAILKKEFNSFFASPIAYLVIGVFLLLNGLFLWIFKNDFNILNAGFADLNAFFSLAPWIFLFLIPAITMKSFAEEYSTGTIELLKTKPISHWHIVLEKFAAVLLLVLTAIIPTLTYAFAVSQLGNPIGNLDFASTLGSYIGLFFLVSTYTAIGIFTSILSKNQIVAFILAVLSTFVLYYGFDSAANSLDQNTVLQQIGIHAHYKSISLGVLDTRDLLYFVSITTFFLFLTKRHLETNKNTKTIALLIVSLLILNILSHSHYKRFDFTSDQRYTLSETTKALVSQVDETLFIQVYLEGDFPSEFKRLQAETKQYLEELASLNQKIKINFKNPDNQRAALIKKGMLPSQLTIEEDGKMSEAIIFPWAEISFGKKTTLVSLLPSSIVASQDEQLKKAIGNLEYEFSSAIQTVTQKKRKNIAILSGNGELTDRYQYSFLSAVAKKHNLAKFSLDAHSITAPQTLKNLSNFDLAVIAKPTEKFTEKEKFIIDQFIVNGGKTLWMLDNVQADQDSLENTGNMLAYPIDLGLTDLLFSYGIRINNSIIKDLYAAKIPVATGNIGKQAQFKNLDWYYHPLAQGNPDNPITKNILPVRLQFANQIDTLKNNIIKTPLLVSSPLTQKVGTPKIIAIQAIAEEVVESDYNSGNQLFGVLLSGNFNSAYRNRIKPFGTSLFKIQSKFNKMIVISDGDVGKNQILKEQPYSLSRDKWTNQQFGNKDFLLNAVDYLLDDIGLLNLRNKSLQIRMLDKQKAYKERFFWQFLNVFLPLAILGTFGLCFRYIRKRKYGFIKP